jgi:hypothetical protein
MSSTTDWNANHSRAFGEAKPEDEFYHGWGPEGDSLTETWYWGFNVPEAAINCFIYCWCHPNLNVVTAGLIIYKGIKRHHLAAEVFDMPAYLKLGPVVGDGSAIQVPNGLTVEVIEPLGHMKLTYEDKGRDTAFAIDLRAVGRPIMRGNNLHFEQVMHAAGRLRLRGEEYPVDGFTVRDRSWGEHRPEGHNPGPPYNWVTGSFDRGRVAFNIGSCDDPAGDPEWLGKIAYQPESIFKDGWIARGDEQRRIVRASKKCWRHSEMLMPERFEIELEDEDGRIEQITGKVIASVPGFHWPNIATHLALVEWQWNGMTGFGESQDVHWNDYVYHCGQIEG